MTRQTPLERVRADLARIPDLYAVLPLHIQRGSIQGSGKGGKPGSRPPLREDVIDLLDTRLKSGYLDADPEIDEDRYGIYGRLWLWNRLLEEEMADAGYRYTACDAETVTQICEWLRFHAEWICEIHEDFPLAMRKLRRTLSVASGEKDLPEPRCPACKWRIEPQDDYAWWSCTGCGKTWRTDAEIRRVFAQQPPMPLRQIAKLVGVSYRTLYRWHTDGRLLPAGHDRRGNLYHVEAVKILIQATRARGA